ncbi:unnamed protein product [Triticum turgidum subsp. durum]|uniref:Uncharacterized protein n=1 Tax=Triticum turgidum subsp. durum TaxID=4567 RepID=A0A9R1REU2_TRITD|nr:unnamed protein product [Triticum turgidum subsp. durum]
MQPSIGLGTCTIQFTSTKHITTKVVTRVLVVDPPDGNYMAWQILMDSNIPQCSGLSLLGTLKFVSTCYPAVYKIQKKFRENLGLKIQRGSGHQREVCRMKVK